MLQVSSKTSSKVSSHSTLLHCLISTIVANFRSSYVVALREESRKHETGQILVEHS